MTIKTKASRNKIVTKDEKYDSTKFWIENGIDLDRRRIMIDEDIDEFSIGWAMRGLRRMVDEDKTKPIDIYINSYGGSCYDGLGLYDFILACSFTTVRTHAIGKVMSMGLILFLAGDERYSSPNSTFMAHSVASGVSGKIYEMKIDTQETDRINKCLLTILENRTDKTYKWWEKQIKHEDKYYDKEQAINLGIVTHKEFEIE